MMSSKSESSHSKTGPFKAMLSHLTKSTNGTKFLTETSKTSEDYIK